jgi:hypothetical protein
VFPHVVLRSQKPVCLPLATYIWKTRYRYYISQAVLQKKPQAPGSVSRVPAAELEALVLAALRHHLNASSAGEQLLGNDRDLVERQLERVTLTSNEIKLRLRKIGEEAPQALCAHDTANDSSGRPVAGVNTIAVDRAAPTRSAWPTGLQRPSAYVAA